MARAALTLFSPLRCQSRPDISLAATSPNAALKGEREISEEGKGIVKAGQESQTGCSYFGSKKNNAAEYLTRQEGTYRKTGQNRTEISETSRRNRSPRGDGPYPWFGAAAWRPAAGGERRRGTCAPAPGWLGLEETCGGPARGHVGTRKRGEFLVIFFLAELAKSTSNNWRNAGRMTCSF